MNSTYKIILAGALVVFASACTATVQAPVQNNVVTPPSTTTIPSQPTDPTTPTTPTTPPTATNPTPAAIALQSGEWGVEGGSVILDIGADSSTLKVGCNNGSIDEPFTVTKGTDGYVFSLAGSYVPGGPPRAIISPTGEPQSPDYSATYSGSMATPRATTMHFVINANAGGMQEYDLTQGQFAPLRQACPL